MATAELLFTAFTFRFIIVLFVLKYTANIKLFFFKSPIRRKFFSTRPCAGGSFLMRLSHFFNQNETSIVETVQTGAGRGRIIRTGMQGMKRYNAEIST
jgi:hypothetical protein